MQTLIDYRNARYQGQTSASQSRNGHGILIDDDLSFYASQWKDGKLNNSTVIYISHGKYIYGNWQDNQPHGLNVFRIGDTVVLGQFYNGYLKNKVLVIFQKFNFVAILEEKGNEWAVCERGILKNYNQLIRYIQQANIPMKPQFFSLTKFLTFISNQKTSAVPCQGSENCYFGYQEGLGIIFNPNNGVVSVGWHQQKKLTQFGGKYQYPKHSFEGNFRTSQIIKYATQRPKNQIYCIFQKLHKRSLNFKNQYFDSKVKLLTHIEELIRTKIDQITNPNNDGEHQNTITALQLNDSLDYHVQNLEQINKMNKIREEVYQQTHVPLKKTISQYVQASPKPCKKSIPSTPVKKKVQPITNAPVSPIAMKKSPIKIKEKQKVDERQKSQQREKSLTRTPSKINYIARAQAKQFKQQTFANLQQEAQIMVKNSRTQQQSNSTIKRPICQVTNKNPYQIRLRNLQLDQPEPQSPIDNILMSSKNYIKQKQIYNVPSFKYTCSDFDKTIQNQTKISRNVLQSKIGGSQRVQRVQRVQRIQRIQRQQKPQKIQNVEWIDSSNGSRCSASPFNAVNKKTTIEVSKSPIKGPNYENLQQRRQRLLKQFKNLSSGQNPMTHSNLGNVSKITTPILKSSPHPPINLQPSQYIPLATQQVPININANANSIKNLPYQYSNKILLQKTDQYTYKNYELESPFARQKLLDYESKNTQQSSTMMPLTICKNTNQISSLEPSKQNQPQIEIKNINYLNYRQNYKQKQKSKPGMYQLNSSKLTQKSYKQNLESSPISTKPFEKKDSYYERIQPSQQERGKVNIQQLTPNRRKSYKYYFDNQ